MKNAEQMWKKLDSLKRLHFIIDHTGKQHTPASQEEISKRAYNFLPADVKDALKKNISSGGLMATGGGIKEESLQDIIDRLSKEKGYPNRFLDKSEYEEVLKKAHQIKYGEPLLKSSKKSSGGSMATGGEAGKGKPKGKVKTKSITVFQFEDLSDEAKEKALDEYRDAGVDYDWWDFVYEDAENIGLKITGFDIDRGKHADGEFINGADECAKEIIKNHGDKTSTYKTAKEYEKDYDALVEKYSDGVKKNVVAEGNEYDFNNDADELGEEFLKSLLEDYAQILQDEYEYKQSDEAVKEMIEANEYEFMEDGSKSSFAKGGIVNFFSDGIDWLITG